MRAEAFKVCDEVRWRSYGVVGIVTQVGATSVVARSSGGQSVTIARRDALDELEVTKEVEQCPFCQGDGDRKGERCEPCGGTGIAKEPA